ncbi:MAG: DUF1697 domain-containing protein, partial [Rhodospirillales bacterium]|nr:DUF1697 domain-containing protein [Rhodospirillales bacterium]
TTPLPMNTLKAVCEAQGFTNVRTYIASGNVVFRSAKSEAAVKAALEAALKAETGKAIRVALRSAEALAAVLAGNPFPHAEAKFTLAIFLDGKPTRAMLDAVTGQADEELALGTREIYAYYPSGQGRSKLKIKGAEDGTARNMNTIAKLVAMAQES